MRSHGLRISEQHGLNPAISVCFFCGKDKELLLFGKLKGDAKAPKRLVANYTPCDECAEKMRRGVAVIEVTLTNNGAPMPIDEGAWPTGRWCVIKPEAAKALFKYTGTKPILLVDSMYQQLISKANETT